MRASTPSHAAELAVRNKKEVLSEINDYQARIKLALKNQYQLANKHYQQVVKNTMFQNPLRLIQTKELAYSNLYERLLKNNPRKIIDLQRDKIDNLLKQVKSEYKHYLNQKNSYYHNLIEKLELVNPLNIMKKGFAIIKQDDVIKKNYQEIDQSKSLSISITGGEITAKIIDMKGNNHE